MKRILSVVAVMLLAVSASAQEHNKKTAAASSAPPTQQAPQSLTALLDRDITSIEDLVVGVAEAMPEEKFNFSPEGLNLPGADYKGVRTFAVQVKHIAASTIGSYGRHSPAKSSRRD
jgi:hypothetical protein